MRWEKLENLLNLFVFPFFAEYSFHKSTEEIVYNEHQDQAEFARFNRFSL